MSDAHQPTSSRWFCHVCEAYFPQPFDPQEPQCVSCHSSFVEDISASSASESPLNHRSNPNLSHHHFIDSFQDDDSPPIPSTRQRYEQQQQQNPRHHQQGANRQPFHQAPYINFIDPLINILSAPSIPDPADHDQPPPSSRPAPQHRLGPHSFSSIGDFLAQHYSPRTFASPNPFSDRSAQNNEHSNHNSNNQNSQDPSTGPRSDAQGIYTFTFASRPSNPNLNGSNEAHHRATDQRPSTELPRSSSDRRAPTEDGFTFGTVGNSPHQPLNGLLSLLQSAFGLTPSNSAASENERRTPERSDSANTPGAQRPTSNEQPPSPPSSSSGSPGTRTDPHEDRSEENSHRTHPRPTPRSPRVNIEESHPLRQFINLLNSLNQSDTTSRTGVNGFVFNGPTGGFGFTTQFDMEHNSPFGQNLGDYVPNDSAMQDILNQLINMTGANGGHNPVPASESTIKSLRKFEFDSSCIGQEESLECAICKDTFAAGDSCMELPCKHFFHDEDCITLWLKQNGSCPVCRYSLVDNNNDDDNNAQGGERARDRNAPESSTSADDSQYRPDPADWLDPDRWYDEEHYEPPFDYD
ncbi:hypothetical protein PtB15_3B138 [Puccinia triticina]|nr:hypothetical protein PtB15_3B138 [Puccinia triticina]